MINFLYTNIGRGHPFYLDGIIEILRQKNLDDFKTTDVFEVSRGLSFATWKLARLLYKIGSTDSIIGKMYNRLRDKSEYDKASLAMNLMGRDVRKTYISDDTRLVVAHPVLVGMLKDRLSLFYQHGEIAVPKQAVVRGAEYIFVPIEQCRPPFLLSGYSKEQLIVTGLCIEPELVELAQSAYENRMKRLTGNEPLTGAFFSSGAEPTPHIEKINAAVISLFQNGGRAFVFASENGKLRKSLSHKLKRINARESVILCTYKNREELNHLTAANFKQFDYFVSPSHERTNWALGLGLPMFILEPSIGPFAPLNRAALLESEVAISIDSSKAASVLPEWLIELRTSGKIARMAENGYNRYPVKGFETIADFLINKFPSIS